MFDGISSDHHQREEGGRRGTWICFESNYRQMIWLLILMMIWSWLGYDLEVLRWKTDKCRGDLGDLRSRTRKLTSWSIWIWNSTNDTYLTNWISSWMKRNYWTSTKRECRTGVDRITFLLIKFGRLSECIIKIDNRQINRSYHRSKSTRLVDNYLI